MAKRESEVRSRLMPRDVRALALTAEDCADYHALDALGISLPSDFVQGQMADIGFAADDTQGLITTASIATPVQFLQTWLPGFVNVLTAARRIDELIGITTAGSWEDEEVVQGVLEPTGNAVPYGDYTNVPLGSWNLNYERRTVVRFEQGFRVGNLEDARSSRMRVNSAAEKRNAASQSLDIQRNRVGFYGYNGGANRTYGFLNDPSLPAYVTVANGASASPLWSSKTYLEITADIRSMFAGLQAAAKDRIDVERENTTLALATSVYQYLGVTSDFGMSVRKWLTETYPNCRPISAPELDAANGGANVAYLYAEKVQDGGSDGGAVWAQVVPAKFQAIGTEKQAKGYVEDFANATAGVFLKRPFAVQRRSGL